MRGLKGKAALVTGGLGDVEATAEEWLKILRVNVIGTSLVTKHIIPQMKERGGGSIINFSSVSGFVGQPKRRLPDRQ